MEGGGNDVFGGLVPLVGSPVGVEIELGGKPADEMLLGGGMELGGGGGGMATSSSSTDLHLGFRLLSSSQTYGITAFYNTVLVSIMRIQIGDAYFRQKSSVNV